MDNDSSRKYSMLKKVSIIVPCYNGEIYVDRSFQSIEIQDYPLIELIVVNDGSTDHSEEKILEWQSRLRKRGIQVHYIKQSNQGLGSAINTGLKYVTGSYLTLLDVDDEFLQGAESERVRYLNIHQSEDVVRSNGWYVRPSGRSLFINEIWEKKIDNLFLALIEGRTNNWAGSYMVRVSSLFSFYPDREIYQSRYGQNLQFLLPLVYKKHAGYIDKPLMNYYQNPNSLTKTEDLKRSKDLELKNAMGYMDIRKHMVQSIVEEKEERNKYFITIDAYYYRNVMRIAGSYGDRSLMKSAFSKLNAMKQCKLNDEITYCRLMHPLVIPVLRAIRKIRSMSGRIAEE